MDAFRVMDRAAALLGQKGEHEVAGELREAAADLRHELAECQATADAARKVHVPLVPPETLVRT